MRGKVTHLGVEVRSHASRIYSTLPGSRFRHVHLIYRVLAIARIAHNHWQQDGDLCAFLRDFGDRCNAAVLAADAVKYERDMAPNCLNRGDYPRVAIIKRPRCTKTTQLPMMFARRGNEDVVVAVITKYLDSELAYRG